MKVVKEFILRGIAGEYILVPVGNTALDFNGLISVNEIGAFLWEKLQQESSMDQLVEAVLEEYEAEEEIARSDMTEFVESLVNIGIVQ